MERYRLDRVLGEGTYGKVWLARVKADGQKVAIKVFKKNRKDSQSEKKKGGSSDNSDHQTQPEEEASILQSLNHPNIIKVFEFISDATDTAMVMEYTDRGDMLNYMNSQPGIGFQESIARDYFRQLVSAIRYLHDLEYIHCDIKLENILLFAGNTIKLTDFGFAIKYSKTKRMKYGNGSLSYASPEVVFKRDFYGPEADIWSLGVVLFTMVCGKFPLDFVHHSVGQAYKNLESQGLSFSDTSLSIECQDLLVQMLEIYADKRITIPKILESDWVTGNKSTLHPDMAKLNLGKLQSMAQGLLSPLNSKNNTPRNSPGRMSPKISPKTNSPKFSVTNPTETIPVNVGDNSPGPILKVVINPLRAPSPLSSPHSQVSPQSSPSRSSRNSPIRTEKDHENIFKTAFRLISPAHRRTSSQPTNKVEEIGLATINEDDDDELAELTNRKIRFNNTTSPSTSPTSMTSTHSPLPPSPLSSLPSPPSPK